MTATILPIEISTVSSESIQLEGERVDVAIFGVSFVPPEGPSFTDAVLVFSHKGRRGVRHFQFSPDGSHFARALALRGDLLDVVSTRKEDP